MEGNKTSSITAFPDMYSQGVSMAPVNIFLTKKQLVTKFDLSKYKIMNKSILTFSVLTLLAISCSQTNKSFYESSQFRILNDRVEQGEFTAKAVSETEMTSNYQSNSYFSSVIQFKFSINGKDNELGYNINHEANIFAPNEPVVIDVVFGKRLELQKGNETGQNLPPNTKVKFRLDFSRVLESFKEKEFYEDVYGEKIY